jgi:hypothetical protein
MLSGMSEDEKKEAQTHHEGNGQKEIAITPIRLLEVILKLVLKERITDEEAERICSVYWQTVAEWWSED